LVMTSRGAIGSVDQARERIKAFADAGVDQLTFIPQAGITRHEHICESMELFASEIMPEFRDGDDERRAARMEELAPYIEAAFERKADKRPLRPSADEIPEYESLALQIKKYGTDAVIFGQKTAQPVTPTNGSAATASVTS
jgi:hypothetical protein